ncbi:ATP-binding protein [Elioraea rosea]|uniref:ATP-binding protein n=1 Tax=Elioraea rosea TaxID=2492390 RepID=UPI0013156C9B|nr:ATP-binding protein [Elioraea rosea]
MPARTRRPSLLTPLGATLILVALAVPAAFYMLAVIGSRTAAEERAREQVERIADAMREHALKVFETQELALDRVADRLEGVDDAEIYGPELGAVLEQITAKLEHTVSMWVTAYDGQVIAGSQPWDRALNLDARPFWRRVRDGEPGPIVGDPFIGRATGLASFPLARRRPSEDGSFRGAIHASLDPEYFERVFARMVPPGGHSAVLARNDGVVLARHGTSPDDTGETRFAAMRGIRGYPVHVRFAVPEEEVRAAWRGPATSYGLAAAVGFLALAAVATLALRESRARQVALVALRSEVEARERSELRLREAARLEGIGRITGGIAHDFNNLLATVLISLDEITERCTGDRAVAANVATAREAARSGAGLVSSLLAYARGQELAPVPLDPAALIEGMLPLLQNAVGQAVVVTMHRRDPVPACSADAAQLRAALLNVAINARDAMPAGGRLTFDVGPARLDADELADNADAVPGFFVAIAITDTGTGIAEDVLPKVFEPFFTTKPPGQGTGLGLAQVFGFVRQSSGHVSITTAKGSGTRVTLYLPATDRPAVPLDEGAPFLRRAAPAVPLAADALAPVAAPALEPILAEAVVSAPARARLPVAAAAPDRAPAAPAIARRRILVADDNAALLALTARILGGAGYEVVQVASGDEAVRLFDRGERFDLVVSDVVMPGEHDGFSVARRAAAAIPPVPVVFMSGYVPEQNRPGVPVAGFVNKPFSRGTLLAAVATGLGAREA